MKKIKNQLIAIITIIIAGMSSIKAQTIGTF